jgi:hypothetical protein
MDDGQHEIRPLPTWLHRLDDGELDRLARRPSWTIAQAVCLSLGLAPDGNWIERCIADVEVDGKGPFDPETRTAREIRHRYKLVQEAMASGTLSDPLPPIEFVDWAARWFDDVPDRVRQAVSIADQSALPGEIQKLYDAERRIAELERENRELVQRLDATKGLRLETALKLAAAMACNLYNFRLETERNRATGDIMKALERFRVALDRSTILDYVRAGGELFPPERRGAVSAIPASGDEK